MKDSLVELPIISVINEAILQLKLFGTPALILFGAESSKCSCQIRQCVGWNISNLFIMAIT